MVYRRVGTFLVGAAGIAGLVGWGPVSSVAATLPIPEKRTAREIRSTSSTPTAAPRVGRSAAWSECRIASGPGSAKPKASARRSMTLKT